MADEKNINKISSLEEKIRQLKRRMPAHSIPPGLLQELEDLEEELESLKAGG